MADIFNLRIVAMTGLALVMTACQTTPDPEPEPEPEPIQIEAERTDCIAPDTLERKVIPAVIKRGFHVTMIENPPEYYTDPETGEVIEITNPPIENKVPYERVIEPERVVWLDKEGNERTDVCLPEGETLESYIPGE